MIRNNMAKVIARIVENEDFEALAALVDTNYDVEKVLANAVLSGKTEIVDSFVNAGWNIEVPLRKGDTLLEIASKIPGNAKMINHLAAKLSPTPL